MMTEILHDRFIAAAALFRAAPSFQHAANVLAAYRRFYVAFTGSEDGMRDAVADLRWMLAREMCGTAGDVTVYRMAAATSRYARRPSPTPQDCA